VLAHLGALLEQVAALVVAQGVGRHHYQAGLVRQGKVMRVVQTQHHQGLALVAAVVRVQLVAQVLVVHQAQAVLDRQIQSLVQRLLTQAVAVVD
jgi:hypothetical protein